VRRLERHSSDLLLYGVAVAKICAQLAASPLWSRNEPLCTHSSTQQSRRYLIVIDGEVSGRLRGGLHNQMMALQSQIDLADALNRTLVLPLFTSSFPKEKENIGLMEFWELFSVDSLKLAHPTRSSEDWLVSLHEVHGGAFLRRTNVSLSVVGDRKSFDATPVLHQNVDFLVANRIVREQPMRSGWLGSSMLELDGKALGAFRDVLCALSQVRQNAGGTAGGGCQASATPHFIAIHLRIESDWLRYSKANNRTFRAYYRFIEEVQAGFREWFMPPRDGSAVPLYLSFDDEKLPPENSKNALEGWPADVHVFTNAAFRRTLLGLSYLEKSAVARELCLSAAHFIGNSHSSFTQLISQARMQVPSRNYLYNCMQPSRSGNHIDQCIGHCECAQTRVAGSD